MSNPTWAHRITMAAVSTVLAGSAVLSTGATASATADSAPISTIRISPVVPGDAQHQNAPTNVTGFRTHWVNKGWYWRNRDCRNAQTAAFNAGALYAQCWAYPSWRGGWYWVLWVWH